MAPLFILFVASLGLFDISQAAPSISFFDRHVRRADVSTNTVRLEFQGCDARQRQRITDAWDDAIKLAKGVSKIDFTKDPAAIDFFGPPGLNKARQSNIQDVFNNIKTFSRGQPGRPSRWRMNIRCGIKNDSTNLCKKPRLVAYQWNTKDAKGTGPRSEDPSAYSNIHFCDRFFTFERVDPMIEKSKNQKDFKRKYNLSNYSKNTGYIMLHEMMHATSMTYKQNGNRRIRDIRMELDTYKQKSDKSWDRQVVQIDAYGPSNCKILARTVKEKVADAITLNADNFAYFALAKYIQSKFDNIYPWLPLANAVAQKYWAPGSVVVLGKEGSGVNEEVHEKISEDNNEMTTPHEHGDLQETDQDTTVIPALEDPAWIDNSQNSAE